MTNHQIREEITRLLLTGNHKERQTAHKLIKQLGELQKKQREQLHRANAQNPTLL